MWRKRGSLIEQVGLFESKGKKKKEERELKENPQKEIKSHKNIS